MHPSTPLSDLVILATTQTHSLAAKAALILGFEFQAIETKQEDDWALRGMDLEEALAALAAKGKKPFILSTFAMSSRWGVRTTLTARSQSQRLARRVPVPSTRLPRSLPSVSN